MVSLRRWLRRWRPPAPNRHGADGHLDEGGNRTPLLRPRPQHRINLVSEIRGLSFPQAGDYVLIIRIDDTPILATTLSVTA